MNCKSKKAKRQAKLRAQRRQVKLEKQRRKRKGKKYDPRRYLTRNQKEVAKRILDGQVTMVTSVSWAFFERFLVFLYELGFFGVIQVDGAYFYRKMISVALLIMTYEVKVLLGISSINQVPSRLFRDRALLLLIGYTADQLASGFCCRGYEDKQKPMHKNTLADAVEKLTAKEVEYILNEAVKRLAERGVFQQSAGHFALDSTDLETTEHYTGAGKKKVTVRKRDKRGKLVEVVEYKYGFKLMVIYEVHLRLIVAAKVVPINQHESNFTLELLKQAIANVGEGVIQVLLIDRGFLDGEDLWTIRHTYHVHFVVPAKDNMHVTADARAFLEEKPDGEYLFADERPGQGQRQSVACPGKQEGQVKLIGVKDVASYDQYGDAQHQKRINRKDFEANPINVIVVTEWEGKPHKAGKEPVFLTSLPVDQPLEVLDAYDLRSLIENCGFRELKQGWHMGKFPKKTAEAVRAHVFLTLVMFNMTNAYRTEIGQDLTKRGIRRQRLAWEDANKVLVVAGEYYAIFDIEELFILMEREPEICWRVDPCEVRRRYGLQVPAIA